MARQVVQHDCMHGATPQAWSNLVWAFAKLRYYEDDGAVFDLAVAALLRDMTTQAVSTFSTLAPQRTTHMGWASCWMPCSRTS